MENYIKEIVPSYIGRAKRGFKIKDAGDCIHLLKSLIKNRDQEHFIAIYLNGAHEVLTYSIVTIGLLNSTQVHPREVFRPAFICAAASVIVAHNHPSDNLSPSKEDIRVTESLGSAAKILGINLLDHIIFTAEGNYISLKEKNLGGF